MKLKILSSLTLFIVTLVYAFYTDHRWEDWYITYKASKNLALGNGLVYHIGEKIMTYTSPLGVLIPAFIKWLFLSKSDDYVIWIFRIINIILLSFIPFFLISTLQHLKIKKVFIYFTLLLITFNILIIDNTINGMESALMVFFISYLIWILFTYPKNFIVHLALSAAGLMYSRPDGFIYGGAIIVCYLLFNKEFNGLTRLKFIPQLGKALLLAFIIYSPWFVWTWMYYGTPIPHTIVAKSVSQPYEFHAMIRGFLGYNYRLLTLQSNVAGSLFMPANSWQFGTWDYFFRLNNISCFFVLIISLYWLYPKGNVYARTISLAVYVMNFYLVRVTGQGPMSWYLPSVIIPAIFGLTLISNDLLEKYKNLNFNYRTLIYSASIFLIVFCVIIFYYGAIQMKAHQDIIEFNNRKNIGLWLKDNGKPGDRIYMECLGYIGFYSELKTLDYPGMSSPEVVAARKELNEYNTFDLPMLVYVLKPEWLILRHWEFKKSREINPELFDELYLLEKIFDVTEQVNKANLKFGSGYLNHDALFYIAKLKTSESIQLQADNQ